MGRPAGLPNRDKRRLQAVCREKYGQEFNIIMKMLDNAHYLQEVADKLKAEDSADAPSATLVANGEWDRAAPYLEPKLKASEVTHNLSDDVDDEKVARITQRLLSGRKAEDSE